MANRNGPSGLSPVSHLLGLNWSARAQVYCIPETDDTNAFAIGDPVILDGGSDAAGVPTITLATAGTGNPVLGSVLSGVGAPHYGMPYGSGGWESPLVIPAVKARNYYVLISDDPFTIYSIQEDSVAGDIALASVGLNANLVAGTNNGTVSGWMLDSSSVATGATLQAKILRVRQLFNNAHGTPYCVYEVLLNNHPFKAGVAGI